MDAADALQELQEVDAHVRAAAVLGADGEPRAATMPEPAAFARAARQLILAADELRRTQRRTLLRLHVVTRDGTLAAVRGEDCWVVAAAARGAPEALLFYDLENCLRALAPARADAHA